MLTLLMAIESETPCEPALLLFAEMNDHLHAAWLLEHIRGGELTPKKIWEAIQTLFAAMNEVQELVASQFWTQDESCIYNIDGLCKHNTSLAVWICNVDLDSGR